MNIRDALKAIAPAVGDGKLVWQHAYVVGGESLRVCNGRMWAGASLDEPTPLFVRYEVLAAAMGRGGAELVVGEDAGVMVRVGRSRLRLRGLDPADFPPEPSGRPDWIHAPRAEFKETLDVLSGFCGKPDNHIWQMGVHFVPGMAFAANPFALTIRQEDWFPHPLSVPPWAARFILAQEGQPNVVGSADRHQTYLWGSRIALTSTLLIEAPSEQIVTYARRILDEPTDGDRVPDNLKDAVQRAKSFGATTVRIGSGVLEHAERNNAGDTSLEFDEEVDIVCAPRTWGVDTLLAALEHAESINLTEGHARWEGGGYKGVFSGMSG